MSLYNLHIEPLVYASAILLPIAYIVGMIFSLKTHAAQINADYMRSLEEANHEGRERERERKREREREREHKERERERKRERERGTQNKDDYMTREREKGGGGEKR